MRTATPTLNDQWMRLTGLPLVAVWGNFIFYEPDNTLHHVSRGLALLMSLLEAVLQWEVSRRGILLAPSFPTTRSGSCPTAGYSP